MTTERWLQVEADGGSRGNPGTAGYGALVRDPATGKVLAERAGYLGLATNNVAEYNGLIAGLEAARSIDPEARIQVRMDSKLVVEQMSGRWKIKHPDMQPLALRARDIARGAHVTYEWIPRELNKAADALANEAMDRRADVSRDFDHGAASSDEAPATLEPSRDPRRVSPLALVFVRHGETEMTESGALSGSGVPGPSLSAGGRVQAAKAADAIYSIGRRTWLRLPTVTRVAASPLVRAQETAAALGRRLGVKVDTDDALREVHFGEWEALTAEQVTDAHGDAIHQWRFGQLAPPGGESILEVGARVDTLIRRLAVEHAASCRVEDVERSVALVSHAVAIKAAVGVSMRMDERMWGSIWPLPASVTILQLMVTEDGDIAERHLLCVGAPTD